MINRQMDPATAEALLKILEDPRFASCLETARQTRETIAERVMRDAIERGDLPA